MGYCDNSRKKSLFQPKGIAMIILKRDCLLLPDEAKNGCLRFPALAGITKSSAGNFSGETANLLNEFCLNNQLASAVCGDHLYHKLIPVHGDEIALTENCGSWKKCDGLIDFRKNPSRDGKIGPALFSVTADCPTIVTTDAEQKHIGIFHSGRMGTEKKIVSKAIKTINDLGIPADNILVGIFPGICGECYEVGPEFEKIFPAGYADGKLNLLTEIIHQLDSARITGRSIFIAWYCSCHSTGNDDHMFFSYRRNRSHQRNAVFIARKK
jgi:copper oxidase (laccase) domain-containing protein